VFIDTAEIVVQAGKGGDGAVSFRREKFVPKGGPDGGDGGNGGDVIFVADSQISTLMDFRYQREYAAEDGHRGSGAKKTGRQGISITVKVPVGTLILDAQTHEPIADLTTNGQQFVVAKRGIGGRGNCQFTTSTVQAPRHAEKGRPGERRTIVLELKLLADVGLVGFPNAGKSTLISRISAARPKIADYPFTTLIPNLGIVRVDDGDSFVVADIPGLIEGASRGKGLGDQFLRHVERSGVLCFLIDGLGEDPLKEFEVLIGELRSYNPEMLEKRRIIALTKADAMTEEERARAAELLLEGNHPKLISSVSGEGIPELVQVMRQELGAWREIEQ
jgi:GTP-binding protein